MSDTGGSSSDGAKWGKGYWKYHFPYYDERGYKGTRDSGLRKRNGYGDYDYYYQKPYQHHQGYDQIDRHGSLSGFGSGHGKVTCCPLVVKPLVILALLGGIAAATAFFNVLITMNIMGRRRRRKREGGVNMLERIEDLALKGMLLFTTVSYLGISTLKIKFNTSSVLLF